MEPGTRLGPYEIAARLGAGGMGEVYRARDTRLGRTVALKVIRSAAGVESDQRRRFRREAEIASRLTHPHVCTLFDVGAEGEVDYLVLEHLEGATLEERIGRGPLPVDEATRIAAEVADALAFAHERGFVHRDLKPGNIFLTPSGAKLLDFGLARPSLPTAPEAADSEAKTAEGPLTEAGTVCGTPPYMSPEQAAGRAVDERSDQFSFGSVLYEMLTGVRAFQGTSTAETLSAVLRDDPLARSGARTLPPPLATVVARLLAKDPGGRYPSTRQLASELARLHHSTASGDATVVLRPVLALGSLRRAVALAGVVAAVALAAGFLVWRTRRAPIDSVAVLPFAASGTDPESALLADGVTESLINGLAELPSLRVMAPSSVAVYRGRETDPREVGRALGVRAVLTGRLVMRAGGVAVSAALADAGDGRHLWGKTYERPAPDVLGAQSQLARDLGHALRPLTGGQEERLARPASEDREAYLLHQKGRYAVGLRTRDGLLKGIGFFRQALARDPTFARAWAGIAEAYDVLAYSSYLPPGEAFGNARDAVRKALELDPRLADAWAVLAHVTMLFDGDSAAAEASFRKAIALNPSCANAHHWYSHLLLAAKPPRPQESLRASRAALEVDPLSLVMNLHMAEHHFFTGDLDAALEQLRRTLEMDPRFGPAHAFLGTVYRRRGDPARAIAALEEAVRLLPDSASALSQLGVAYAEGGRRADAERIQSLLDAMASEGYVSPMARAYVAAALRDERRTLDALERALEVGERRLIASHQNRGTFTFLEAEPRYRALLERLPR